MINTSNEFREHLAGTRQFRTKAGITLGDATELNVDSSQIVEQGMKIEDGTSQQGKFTIGSFVINRLTLILKNTDDQFSEYDFYDAVVRPQIGLVLSETTEYLNKGVFTVDDPSRTTNGDIKLECLDNGYKFDTPYKDVAVTYPISALNLALTVCTHCGVTLATVDFTNKDFVIQSAPDAEALTCRDVMSYIAQLAGCFARCNVQGALELRWYDIAAFEQEDSLYGGRFDFANPYATGDSADGGTFAYNDGDSADGGTFVSAKKYHHIFSLASGAIGTDDVVITGIKVSADAVEPEEYLFGTTGYVLSIENNPFIQIGQAQTIAESVGAKIVGMQFRPLSIKALSDPTIEAGDIGYVTDRKGNSYKTLFTNLYYTIGQYETITCDAESPLTNSAVRFSQATKTIIEARKHVKAEQTARELAIQQLNDVIENSSGLYQTLTTQPDGSKIYYLHDKATLAESQVVWKMTAEAFAVSTDGGETYTAGMTASGDAIVTRLSAIGIDADWINAGDIRGVNMHGGKYYDETDNMYLELQDLTTYGLPFAMSFFSNYANHDGTKAFLESFRHWARRTKNADGVSYDYYSALNLGAGDLLRSSGNTVGGGKHYPMGPWDFNQATVANLHGYATDGELGAVSSAVSAAQQNITTINNTIARMVSYFAAGRPLKLDYNATQKRLLLLDGNGYTIGYIPYT